MNQFIERWHLALGVSGLSVGLGVVVVVSVGPLQRLDPTPLVVFVAIVCTWLRGEVDHGVSWLFAGGLALLSTRSSERDGGSVDRWAIGLVLLAAIGLWATVPDTESTLLAGSILGPVLVQSAVIGRRFGSSQLFVCFLALTPAAIWGAAGTSAGLLGGLCCVVWVIVAALVVPSLRSRPSSRRPLGVGLVAQSITVALASRVVGHAETVTVRIVAGALVVSAVVLGLALSAGTFGERRVVSSALPGRRSDDK